LAIVSPLIIVIIVAGAATVFAWISSIVTGDSSWVDRLWSIVPVVYVWIFAGAAGFADARLDVMAILVTAWGARLTYNFARKGGYTGVEDYRWPILRARMTPLQYQFFNFFFTHIFQNAVILLMTLPALTAFEHQTPFGLGDMLLALLFLAFLGGETLADQQQWDFHFAKRAGGANFRPRFLQSGMWRFSRHPNYFFELAQWWTFFFIGVVAAGSILQWTVVGVALLTILFIGSTIFTESITKSKYPEYAEYQAAVSPIVPWPRRRSALTGAPADS